MRERVYEYGNNWKDKEKNVRTIALQEIKPIYCGVVYLFCIYFSGLVELESLIYNRTPLPDFSYHFHLFVTLYPQTMYVLNHFLSQHFYRDVVTNRNHKQGSEHHSTARWYLFKFQLFSSKIHYLCCKKIVKMKKTI